MRSAVQMVQKFITRKHERVVEAEKRFADQKKFMQEMLANPEETAERIAAQAGRLQLASNDLARAQHAYSEALPLAVDGGLTVAEIEALPGWHKHTGTSASECSEPLRGAAPGVVCGGPSVGITDGQPRCSLHFKAPVQKKEMASCGS